MSKHIDDLVSEAEKIGRCPGDGQPDAAPPDNMIGDTGASDPFAGGVAGNRYDDPAQDFKERSVDVGGRCEIPANIPLGGFGKKVFIDLGYHKGEGLAEFREKLGIDRTWDVLLFEPNVEAYRETWGEGAFHGQRIGINGLDCAVFPVAVSGRKGPVNLRRQHVDGRPGGWGSTIEHASVHPDLQSEVVVRAMALSEVLLMETGEDDVVWIKMDIEGSEFGVLGELLETPELFENIVGIWVEWHQRFMPTESDMTRDALVGRLSQLTEVHEHW